MCWSLLAALVCFASLVKSVPIECSSPDLPVEVLETDYGRFEFKGNKVIAIAKDPTTGALLPAGQLDYILEAFLESKTLWNGTADTCQPIPSLFLEPIVPSKFYEGAVYIRNLSNSDSLCVVEKKMISIGQDKFAEVVTMNITWPDDPAATFRLTFGLINTTETVVVRSYDARPSTQGYNLSYAYQYASLSLSLSLTLTLSPSIIID
jgi:hypothetical protein